MKEQLINDILRNLPYVEEMAVSHIQAYGKQNTKDDFVLQDFVENIKKLPDILLHPKDMSPEDILKEAYSMGDFVRGICEDKVNSPAHYNNGEIECIDAIASALSLDELKGFVKGNVIKYMWRANHKEKEVEDLKKARWYLDYLIKKLS